MASNMLQQRESDPLYRAITAFEDQYINLRRTWLVFQTLFMKSHYAELLHQAGAQTFHEIGISMLQHILMQLSRLIDHPGKGHQKHLCLRQIRCDVVAFLKNREGDSYKDTHREFLNDIEALGKRGQSIAKKLRHHRGDSIAHLDWHRALGDRDKPLPSLTFREINELITLIGEMIHRLTRYFWNTGCEQEWSTYDRAERLFTALAKGLEGGGAS